MRPSVVIVLVLFFLSGLMPVSAQTYLGVGFYEFESMSSGAFIGTWTTNLFSGTSSVVLRATATVNGSVTFHVANAGTIVIYRLVRNTVNSMSVCVNGACTGVNNEIASATSYILPVAFVVPANSAIIVQQATGTISLDAVMILSTASGSFPTPVPTATIIPSATPATTTTPQPTPTPQPTSTPQPTTTPISVIWSIDPAKSYSSIDGQITSVEYSATAADIQLANLLTMLLLSIWGMFIFVVFVLVRFKR